MPGCAFSFFGVFLVGFVWVQGEDHAELANGQVGIWVEIRSREKKFDFLKMDLRHVWK